MANQILHGIVPTSDGHYVMVSLRCRGTEWQAAPVRKWECRDRLRTALLGPKGVSVGVPSFWRSSNSGLAISGTQSAQNAGVMTAQSHTAQLAIHTAVLRANLTALYTDDAFLCTLPLAFIPGCPDSFVSIYQAEKSVRVGVVLNRTLAWSIEAPSDANCAGLLDRTTRFVSAAFPQAPAVKTVVTIGNIDLAGADDFSILKFVPKGLAGSADIDTLRAMGVALAPAMGGVPAFDCDTSVAKLRRPRFALVCATMVILALALIGAATAFGTRVAADWQVRKAQNEYRRTIAANTDLQSMLKANESTARQILDLENHFALHTNWSGLLSAMGAARPAGLCFERLGSDALDLRSGTVNLAFSGWASNDTTVTRFIHTLQGRSFLSHVSLSSIEQAAESRRTVFTISCTAHFPKP